MHHQARSSSKLETIPVSRSSLTPKHTGLWIVLFAALAAISTLFISQTTAKAGCPDPASLVLSKQISDKTGPDSLDCSPAWQTVSSPNVGADGSHLYSVDAVSASNIWAVGNSGNGTADRTLIERWNGGVWSAVASPNVNASYHILSGVYAVSANDVWAVGNYYAGSTSQTLILHWNGTLWSIVSSPNVGANSNMLRSVTATAANDAWAVGEYYDGSHNQTLIMRWNGTTWNVVSSPNVGANSNSLQSVSARSSTDAWAAGNYFNGSINQTLIMRWNGTTWNVVSSPNTGSEDNYLNEITAISANDAWAVGYYRSFSTARTLTLHWNGATWSAVSSPNVGSESNTLTSLVATASNNVWAVGYAGLVAPQTLIMNWNGATWTVDASNNLGSDSNYLTGITAVTAQDVWTVGYYIDGGVSKTLTERYNPCCSTVFTDVPPGSTFHEYVTCLACGDIIGGYETGCETGNPCFRPSNNVTRAQLAKIVSQAAGFAELVGAQQYEDITPGSTFYDYVWRLTNRGYINGYPCGGPGEPCGSGSKPYYRPNANVTRGQTAKIVASARNLPAPPAGQRTFEDVTIGSTFWQWIEELSTAGAIGGYPCGGSGEPCVAPGNRPYFRPGSNVTRGQSAKIVSETFFPTCATP